MAKTVRLENLNNMELADLLSEVIDASGMSVNRFARDELKRDPRLVRRWLKDDVDIPDAVGEWVVDRINRARLDNGGGAA